MVEIKYYWTQTCVPCKLMTPILERIERDNKEVQIVKIEATKTNKEGVTTTPTFVFMHEDKEVIRLFGAQPLAKLNALINNINNPNKEGLIE